MPILKAEDALPELPSVTVIYGDPGAGKTSLANTANNPVLIDFDRGIKRSCNRKETFIPDNWEEIQSEERNGYFKKFSTIIMDTAKAALDDFLMSYVCRLDYKNVKNKLQAYGAIGDEFKRFINACRESGTDIIIIAHAKKDEDLKKIIPDVTGQSYNLLLRIADQIGYVTYKGNQPVIIWSHTDTSVGKNTAQLPETPIPHKDTADFRNFMADVIAKAKLSMKSLSEAQQTQLRVLEEFMTRIENATEIVDLGLILSDSESLPKSASQQIVHLIKERGKMIVPSIETCDGLNGAIALFTTAPLKLTKDVTTVIKTVQDKLSLKWDEGKMLFYKEQVQQNPTENPSSQSTNTHLNTANLNDGVQQPMFS